MIPQVILRVYSPCRTRRLLPRLLAWGVLCQAGPGLIGSWPRIDNCPASVQYLLDFRTVHSPKVGMNLGGNANVEVTKALAALQPLYGKDNVEIVTVDGQRVRGIVRSMKTTQALTTPSVKMECANGEIVKIPFPTIAEIKDHNSVSSEH